MSIILKGVGMFPAKRRFSVSFLLIAVSTMSLAAASVSRADAAPPDTGSKASPASVSTAVSDPLKSDPRFDQKIAVCAECLPVGELISLLAKKADLPLQVQADIAEEKIIVLVPARPLRETLADIAALFNNRWIRIDKDQPPGKLVCFKMIRDVRARNKEEELLNGPSRRLIAGLEEQVQALEDNPEQLKHRSPLIAASLTDPDRRLATEVYAQLTTEQKGYLFTVGHSMSVPFASLNSGQQQILLQWLSRHNQVEHEHDIQEGIGSLEPGSDTGGFITASQVISRVEFVQGAMRLVLYYRRDRNMADVRLQLGRHVFVPMRRLRDEKSIRLAEHADPYTGTPVDATASLPDAGAFEQAPKENDYVRQLRRQFDESGQPIISDFFVCTPDESAVGLADPAPAALRSMDHYALSHNRLWWLRQHTLLLRLRDWFVQRQYEVPYRWMHDVAEQLRISNNVPTYRAVTSVLNLTPRQLTGLCRAYNGPPPPDDFDEADGMQELVRVLQGVQSDPNQPVPVSYRGWQRLAQWNKNAHDTGKYEPPQQFDVTSSLPSWFPDYITKAYPLRFDSSARYALEATYDPLAVPFKIDLAEDGDIRVLEKRRSASGVSSAQQRDLQQQITQEIGDRIEAAMLQPKSRDKTHVMVNMRLIGYAAANIVGEEPHFTGVAYAGFPLPLVIPNDHHAEIEIVLAPK